MGHYEELGVARSATHDEIKRAYYRLARRHHPDAHGQSSSAVQASARQIMVKINAAWAVLGEPAERSRYDLESAPPAPSARPASAAGGAERPVRARVFPDWFEPDDWSDADEEVPAYRLQEDVDDGVRGAADLIVFVPVGLAGLAVVCFTLGMVLQWTALFDLSFLLVPLSLVGFLAAPVVTIATRGRSRPARD